MDIIKLEKPRGKETEKLWGDRISNTIRWRMANRFGDKMMLRGRRRFLGQHWDKDVDSIGEDEDVTSSNPNEHITVNLTGSTVQDFIPFLVRMMPKFELLPRNQDAIDSAKVASAYFNWSWLEYGFQPQLRRAVQDGLVVGTGVLKTGYNYQLEATEDQSGRVGYNDNIVWDAPAMQRVDPMRFYIEPTAPQFDVKSARWCFEVIPQVLQDVVENPAYSSKVRSGLKSGRITAETIGDYLNRSEEVKSERDFEQTLNPAQQVIITYEVWDKKFDKYWLLINASGEPAVLMEESNPYPYLDGLPYNQWKYQEINGEIGAPGVPEIMKDQQDELNRVRTSEFDHRRKHGKRLLTIQEDGIDNSEIVRWLQGEADYLKVNNPDAVKDFPSPALPADNYRIDSVIQNDIRQLTGQDELQRGGALPSRTSAREVQARQSIMGTKTAGRSALVDELVASAARQIVQHMQANLESRQVIRLTGQPTETGLDWLEMTPDDIRHEYDLQFESTSRSEVTPEADKASRMQLFERAVQAAPFMAQQGRQIDLTELFKWALEPHERKVELDRFFIQVPVPPAQPGQPGDSTNPAADQAQSALSAQSVQSGSLQG